MVFYILYRNGDFNVQVKIFKKAFMLNFAKWSCQFIHKDNLETLDVMFLYAAWAFIKAKLMELS